MATFGRVSTPDKETLKRLDESVSVRSDLREKLKGLYKKLKELEAETRVVEGEYKALESQARTSVVVFEPNDGNTGLVMLSNDGRVCRLKGGRQWEAFSAEIVPKGTPDVLEFRPMPQTKKAGHRENIYVTKGTPLKMHFNSLNDARLWWADGAPESTTPLSRWSV
jgi:hypothetical protein